MVMVHAEVRASLSFSHYFPLPAPHMLRRYHRFAGQRKKSSPSSFPSRLCWMLSRAWPKVSASQVWWHMPLINPIPQEDFSV